MEDGDDSSRRSTLPAGGFRPTRPRSARAASSSASASASERAPLFHALLHASTPTPMASLPLLLAFALAPASSLAPAPLVPRAGPRDNHPVPRPLQASRPKPPTTASAAPSPRWPVIREFLNLDDPLSLYNTQSRREFKQKVVVMRNWNGGELHFNVGENPRF